MKNCKYCKTEHDEKEVRRIYGAHSLTYSFGFCSPKCYTDYGIEKKRESNRTNFLFKDCTGHGEDCHSDADPGL